MPKFDFSDYFPLRCLKKNISPLPNNFIFVADFHIPIKNLLKKIGIMMLQLALQR